MIRVLHDLLVLSSLYQKRDPLMSKLKEQRALLEKLCKNTKIAVAEKNSMMSRINALSGIWKFVKLI